MQCLIHIIIITKLIACIVDINVHLALHIINVLPAMEVFYFHLNNKKDF